MIMTHRRRIAILVFLLLESKSCNEDNDDLDSENDPDVFIVEEVVVITSGSWSTLG